MTQEPGSEQWRRAEANRLWDFASAAAVPGHGFGWLDDRGDVDPARGFPLWITGRMTHVFVLAQRAGRDGAEALVAQGIAALRGEFTDTANGGWYSTLDAAGLPISARKGAYDHAFVLLAASSAVRVGAPGAAELLTDIGEVISMRFWSEAEGRCQESFANDWSDPEAYRGANANMHSVEAFLAAADASGDGIWRDRALRIATALIDGAARAHSWRIPEHFDTDWTVLPEYNADNRRDQFRPYGITPGHGLEWSRLLVELAASLTDPPQWLVPAAQSLFAEALRGWAADGTEGFSYTLDWDNNPVVRERMHWVAAEATLAADALARVTGAASYSEQAASWWPHIDEHFRDTEFGSWHHELTPDLQPSDTVWSGKPDAYHAVQACCLPDS
ncbi:MAG: AGE family epimerase/isomerase [Jatrophihabitans sp.]